MPPKHPQSVPKTEPIPTTELGQKGSSPKALTMPKAKEEKKKDTPITPDYIQEIPGLSIRSIKMKKSFELGFKEQKTEPILNAQVEEATIKKVWQEFIQFTEKSGKKLLASGLKLARFRFEKEKCCVVLSFPSNTLKEETKKMDQDITAFLREKLKNDSLYLIYESQEFVKVKTAYTPQEKYKVLEEKNSDLIDLAKRLHLEFNHQY